MLTIFIVKTVKIHESMSWHVTSTLCPRHVHHPSVKQNIAYADAYSLQPILPLYGRFTTLFTVPHQCSKQCNAMEEISGRADGADETRIDEFTTEVAQEEICDGADCRMWKVVPQLLVPFFGIVFGREAWPSGCRLSFFLNTCRSPLNLGIWTDYHCHLSWILALAHGVFPFPDSGKHLPDCIPSAGTADATYYRTSSLID